MVEVKREGGRGSTRRVGAEHIWQVVLVNGAEAVFAVDEVRGAAHPDEAAEGGSRAVEAAFGAAHVLDDLDRRAEDEGDGAFEGGNLTGVPLKLRDGGAGAGAAIVQVGGILPGGEEERGGEASAAVWGNGEGSSSGRGVVSQCPERRVQPARAAAGAQDGCLRRAASEGY